MILFFRSRNQRHFFFFSIFRSRHSFWSAFRALIFLLFQLLPPPFLDELWFCGQNPLRKCVFLLQLSTLVTLVIVVRSVVSNSVAGALFVVEVHISFNRIANSVSGPAVIEFLEPFAQWNYIIRPISNDVVVS